jgi:cytidine deaminase
MTPSTPDDLRLLAEAEALLPRAHSPYSGIAVAAIVVADDGRHFGGVNVENTSLSLTVCAERSALVQAVAAGAAGRGAATGSRIVTIAFTSNHPDVQVPCGACRQVISELAPHARLLFGRAGRVEKVWKSIADLLPEAFDSTWKTGGP